MVISVAGSTASSRANPSSLLKVSAKAQINTIIKVSLSAILTLEIITALGLTSLISILHKCVTAARWYLAFGKNSVVLINICSAVYLHAAFFLATKWHAYLSVSAVVIQCPHFGTNDVQTFRSLAGGFNEGTMD